MTHLCDLPSESQLWAARQFQDLIYAAKARYARGEPLIYGDLDDCINETIDMARTLNTPNHFHYAAE